MSSSEDDGPRAAETYARSRSKTQRRQLGPWIGPKWSLALCMTQPVPLPCGATLAKTPHLLVHSFAKHFYIIPCLHQLEQDDGTDPGRALREVMLAMNKSSTHILFLQHENYRAPELEGIIQNPSEDLSLSDYTNNSLHSSLAGLYGKEKQKSSVHQASLPSWELLTRRELLFHPDFI